MENKLQKIPPRQMTNRPFSFVANTYEEAMKFSSILAKSNFVPPYLKGKPEEVFLTIQFGQELGLAPLQAVQNISIINGKPAVWGTALVAIVRAHPEFEYMRETIVKGDKPEDWGVQCELKRRGQPPVFSTFTVKDAMTAKLWKKAGPWTLYPKRMLTWRARTTNCNDVFADALKGFISIEEAQDYPLVGESSTTTYVSPPPSEEDINQIFEIDGLDLFDQTEYIDKSYDPKTGELNQFDEEAEEND